MSTEQLATALIAAGLFTADDVKAFLDSLPAEQRPLDGKSFANLLCERRQLTKFQAEAVLTGDPTPLVLGDYVLLDKIGVGGMGRVFKAQHRHMKRLAAIKLMPPSVTQNEAAVKRFRREVEAAARLSHPHIVQTYDAGVQRGVWFLVMEYVDGRDLAGVIASEGPLPIARAVDHVRQAAIGLAFAHDSGVVHRDVKPANLLLDQKGVVKILDLGLARFDDKSAELDGLTSSGLVMGTVDFMAPEQAFDTRTADARADVYSLGCTLFRLLTNKNLYEGETLVKKLLAHQQTAIPSLATVRHDVPDDLAAIFARMVAKQPDDRVQTMREVAAALAKIAARLDSPGAAELDRGDLPPTIALHHPQQSTEPALVRTIAMARESSPRKAPTAAWSRQRWAAIVCLSTGLLVALGLGIWFQANPPARVGIPTGGSGTIKHQEPENPAGWQGWPASAPRPAIAPFTAVEARQLQEEWATHLQVLPAYENSLGMKFVLIPPGEYWRGSAAEEIKQLIDSGVNDDPWREKLRSEGPRHQVILTQPLFMGVHEVTQANYEEIVGKNPAVFSATGAQQGLVAELDTKNFPVENVSWNEAALFCAELSRREKMPALYFDNGESVTSKSGEGYRLPSEAEWEFACRAGTTTEYWTGDQPEQLLQAAWCYPNAENRTHAVGDKLANPFGLYDVHGNAWEWTQDFFDLKTYQQFADRPAIDPRGPERSTPTPRAVRGGCWLYGVEVTRSADRDAQDAPHRDGLCGFRVALSVEAVKRALAERQD